MTEKRAAPFAFEGLDRIFHEKARLGILTSLAGHPKGLGFTELKELCGLTDGNLSRHIQVLEEAGLVNLTKGYEGKRPHTSCRMTEEGRLRFANYLTTLERVLKNAARANARAQAGKKGSLKEQPA
jgi:DNA-binding MarR family transcriptional regulator